jgi:hypothetical protein
MAAKPIKRPIKPLEPPNDGFPPEKDVSTPPPGTDQAKDHADRKKK